MKNFLRTGKDIFLTLSGIKKLPIKDSISRWGFLGYYETDLEYKPKACLSGLIDFTSNKGMVKGFGWNNSITERNKLTHKLSTSKQQVLGHLSLETKDLTLLMIPEEGQPFTNTLFQLKLDTEKNLYIGTGTRYEGYFGFEEWKSHSEFLEITNRLNPVYQGIAKLQFAKYEMPKNNVHPEIEKDLEQLRKNTIRRQISSPYGL